MANRLTFSCFILGGIVISLFLITLCFRNFGNEDSDPIYIALILGARSYLADHKILLAGPGPSLDEIRNYLEESDYRQLSLNRDVIYTFDNARVQGFSPGLIAFDRRQSPALCIFVDGRLESWDAILLDISMEKTFH